MKLNAYYLRAHMYTLVPRHVREDMEWMAGIGTDIVSLAILEQDLTAVPRNLDCICREAERAGMQVYAVPSRWAGLTAGAPKVPSQFAAAHPETWLREANGRPHVNPFSGPACDVTHSAVGDFFRGQLSVLLKQWPIRGLIWDEPKTLETQGPLALARFYDAMGAHARLVRPDVKLAMFLHSYQGAALAEPCAAIPNLDIFGCDGRPWGPAEAPLVDNDAKVLLGGHGERFLAQARAQGKQSLLLVENHDLPAKAGPVLEANLPRILALKPDHLIYYYYPRNLEDPELIMNIMARALASHTRELK
jgi:hypothetical protein